MGIFTKINKDLNDAYHYMLPKSAWEYTKKGVNAVNNLVADLTTGAAKAVFVSGKSIVMATPSIVKAIGSGLKGIFWDLPKAAYYHYRQDEEQVAITLNAAKEDINYMGTELGNAASVGVNTAYDGLKPVVIDAVTSVVSNTREVIEDTVAVASIAAIETVKTTATVSAGLMERLYNVVLAIGGDENYDNVALSFTASEDDFLLVDFNKFRTTDNSWFSPSDLKEEDFKVRKAAVAA